MILFSAEALTASLLLDGTLPAPPGAWLTALIRAWGPTAARFAIAFSVLLATFAGLRYRAAVKPVLVSAANAPVRATWLAVHGAAMGLFALASTHVYGAGFSAVDSNRAAMAWIAAAAVAIFGAGLAFLPWKFWAGLVRATGRLWIYSLVSAALICASTAMLRDLWRPTSRLTFRLVELFLTPFLAHMVIQPEQMRIGSQRFTVIISDQCSGLEGIGLLIIFGCMWLLLFRDEARFPQAFALLPLGLATLFLLNSFRIAALVLIGNAGAPEIAAGGFHSQAGWILFNSVAFGSAVLARRWSWVSLRTEPDAAVEIASEGQDPTAAFLMPFLAILCAAMISRAVSGSFEWLYALRFVAALGTLWSFRRSYAHLDWRCGILAPVIGVAVFAIWIAADRFEGRSMPMPEALAAAPAALRYAWIAMRVVGAVVTVPIAEELAFRGYAMRRLIAADFDSVALRSVTWIALAGSSVAFGIMHGERWLVASVAGVLFGLLVKRTGRIGDAIVAHAAANALLAIVVIAFGAWQLW